LYNSRIIAAYIKLIREKYSSVSIGDLLRHAQMKPYEVADQGHWFTQSQVDLFYEKLVRVTGNENIAREAGRYAASPQTIGAMRQYFLGLVGPAKAYEMIGKAAANFTRSTHYESKKIASNKFEITVTPRPGINEKPYQCQNRAGFIEAVAMAFTNKLPHIEHLECMFEGGKVCRYITSWEEASSHAWKKARNYFAFSLSIVGIPLLAIKPDWALGTLLPASAVIVLLLTIVSSHLAAKEMKSSLYNLRNSTDKLLEQIEINYNNAFMTSEIGQAISKQTHINDILEKVALISENRLDFDRGLILLANREKTKLEFRAGFGYSTKQFELIKSTTFRLDQPKSRGIFVVSFRSKKPFLINNINEIEDDLSPKSLEFAKILGSRSFICCPIICDEEAIGILAVDNLKSKRSLLKSDMSLLMGIALAIGISIRNAELLESKTRQFSSTLQALAASIDARDTLTAGHSKKVTEYAMGICNELGLSRDYQEMIRVAALLHDYGKIGVPDAILKKQGRLTEEEYQIVKTHVVKTMEILDQVNFEGIYSQVPDIAGSHHEKLDGSGYPRGLKEKEIPLGAKIIAVADFFEAITSKRHYREPMAIDRAFGLLRDECGRHLDEKVVDAFFKYCAKAHVFQPHEMETSSHRAVYN
ncbi:MAG: HD-GYP domain-containing protein, partial [Deltaproteobacteria bacterium]|nr:HD-GYP domain-containing protein [Deltaproteobacteria bacterium]